MCRFAFQTAECCLVFDRPTGAKLIGIFYIVLFFFGLIGPLVELNSYRAKKYTASSTEKVVNGTKERKKERTDGWRRSNVC